MVFCTIVVWYGMVWYGMVWYGMVWCGMVWYVYDAVWYTIHILYGTICQGMDYFLFTAAAKLYQLEKESLQNEKELLICTNQLKLLERDKIRQGVLALDEDLSMAQKLTEKEVQVYEIQCEILGTCFAIQDKDEKIVRLDLQRLASAVNGAESEKLKESLTKKLTAISMKKAGLRNKKVNCMVYGKLWNSVVYYIRYDVIYRYYTA